MQKLVKFICGIISFAMLALCALCIFVAAVLPTDFLVTKGQELTLANLPYIKVQKQTGDSPASAQQSGTSYNTTLSFLGVVPIKTVRAHIVDSRVVSVYGTPFGIKMFSNGVMVVGFSDINTDIGYQNPAKLAGIKLGDLIKTANGKALKSNEEFAKLVKENGEKPIAIAFERSGELKETVLTPVKEISTNNYRAGMWVRDSSAGLGTLTFVDGKTGIFGGLGHSINDIDTGESIELLSGEIVQVEITGVAKGEAGSPGELKGRFPFSEANGTILHNGATGVYGKSFITQQGVQMQVANAQQINTGEAQILTTIAGYKPALYNVVIEKISLNGDNPNKNMVIRITDPELLRRTGGIVQGMSGSPIIQNGYFIGAVTHVLVNDPTRGFAIFAENMLQTADSVAQGKLQNAA